MSENDAGAPPAGEAISVIELPTTTPERISPHEAARMLATMRVKKPTDPNSGAPPAAAALEPETPSGDEPEAGTDENPPTGDETESAPDTAAEPPIEPPRSWTKEAKERFASLPRDTQEYLAAREDERDRDFNRRQTESAEKLKGLTAKEQQVEQARQQYETALPALMQQLEQQYQGQFADIKSMEDVTKLAQTDWPRYVLWDAQQKQIAAVQQQVKTATDRQTQEKNSKLSEFIKSEGELLKAHVPELADPAKAKTLQEAVVKLLTDTGFSDDDLGKMWRGEKEVSLHDHKFQRVLREAALYRSAQAKAKAATTKPVPQVQRPGVSQPRGAQQDAVIQGLTKQLEKSGSAKDAAKLLMERRRARG